MGALVNVSCVKLPRAARAPDGPPTAEAAAPSESALININTATREELERLPGVGASLAARIVEHRERFGPFRRTEHLLMVRGISERRFREMRARVKTE